MVSGKMNEAFWGLTVGFEGLGEFAFVVGFAERLTLVVSVLSLAEGNFHFRQTTVVDEQFERNDGFAVIFGGFLQFAYFPALQEQFAVPFGVMVGIGAEAVLGYMHLLDIHLPVLDRAVRVNERSFALPDGFDFRSVKHNARRISVKDDILKSCPFIENFYVTFLLHSYRHHVLDRRSTVGRLSVDCRY